MNKTNFRNRTLDVNKAMPVFRSEDMPELSETLVSATRRSVPTISSGMEKEEESEHHLQRALSAQQCYGSAQELAIPIPAISQDSNEYEQLYRADFKQQRQLIHIQAFGFEQEKPDYDMDSEDEDWLTRQAKKMNIKPLQFEEMMDRLEKGSGQQVVQISEAKALLKEDDDLTIAVYDYWLNKKLRLQNPLIPSVKTEKRDGSSSVNPYVAFRRRSEKMQTRKNRKNDEVSYEKMVKLQRDLKKALTLLDFIRRREKMKQELLRLTVEICEKRHEIRDVDGRLLNEAEAQKRSKPQYAAFAHYQRSEEKRRNRENRKRKQRASDEHIDNNYRLWEKQARAVEEHREEEDPDGAYAFYRKEGCVYLPPTDGWSVEPAAVKPRLSADRERSKQSRWVLCQLRYPRRCIGYGRRRLGRGGRVLIDRRETEWDPVLTDVDLASRDTADDTANEYIQHVASSRIPWFSPLTSRDDEHVTPAARPQQTTVYYSQQRRIASRAKPTNSSFNSGSSSATSGAAVSLVHQQQRRLAHLLHQQQQQQQQRDTIKQEKSRETVGDSPLSNSPAASVYQLNFPQHSTVNALQAGTTPSTLMHRKSIA